MPAILLVRHAQASFGADDYDVLSARGRRQCRILSSALRRSGVVPTRVISGTLRRQQDTARACAALAERQLDRDGRWDEYDTPEVLIHHGPPEARTGELRLWPPKIPSGDFQDVLDAAVLEWIAAGPATGCAQPWSGFRDTARRALDDLVSSLRSQETAVVITSGGTIAALCTSLLELPPTAFVALNRVAVNTGISRVVHGRRGTSLISYNEHSHLGARPELLTYR
jgi:broad specificity phosphatase PhoE